MKIICNREKLSSAFSAVALVVKPQTPKAILRNIKLEARDSELILYATDMEMGIRVAVPCDQIEQSGCVMLPVDRVAPWLRESSTDEIYIESDETRTQLRSNSKFVFPTEDPEDFPAVPSFDATGYVVTQARYFQEAIKRTTFATDPESGKYALGGVLLDYAEGKLTLVATDGRRLAAQELVARVEGEFPEKKLAIATAKSLEVLNRLLPGAEEEVFLAMLDNHFMIQAGSLFFYASLLEGRFPEWRRGVGQVVNPKSLEIPNKPFLSAIRMASIVTDRTKPGVIFEFDPGKMTVFANNADRGEIEQSFPVSYDGEHWEMKVSDSYIADFLKTQDLDGNTCMQYVNTQIAILLVTNDGYRYLIMPMEHKPRVRAEATSEAEVAGEKNTEDNTQVEENAEVANASEVPAEGETDENQERPE